MHHAELVEPGRPREQVLALRHAPREVVEPNSPLVETTFTQVRVVVQIDQHPRSRTGEQHGVSAVLVTVVRRRHRQPGEPEDPAVPIGALTTVHRNTHLAM